MSKNALKYAQDSLQKKNRNLVDIYMEQWRIKTIAKKSICEGAFKPFMMEAVII